MTITGGQQYWTNKTQHTSRGNDEFDRTFHIRIADVDEPDLIWSILLLISDIWRGREDLQYIVFILNVPPVRDI